MEKKTWFGQVAGQPRNIREIAGIRYDLKNTVEFSAFQSVVGSMASREPSRKNMVNQAVKILKGI